MEILAYIIVVPSVILFIVSAFLCFNYLYFRKGNIKRAFLLFLVSIVLIVGSTGLGILAEINKPPFVYPISENAKAVLETKSFEQATEEERLEIMNLGFLPISDQDKETYGNKIKAFYVTYHSQLRNVDESTISAEYDAATASRNDEKD